MHGGKGVPTMLGSLVPVEESSEDSEKIQLAPSDSVQYMLFICIIRSAIKLEKYHFVLGLSCLFN